MKKTTILLALILLFSFFLRFIDLSNNPPALYGDELTIVLDAKSLYQTGKDQTGQSFPLFFSMGGGRPPVYVYASIPFVAFFQDSTLGVRSLSALSGVLLVLLIFLIGKKLISEKAGLFAASLMAISTWDISLSRAGFEAHFALFLSVLGVFLYLKGKENGWYYPLSALLFGFAIHTYPTYKLTLFLFIPTLVLFTNKISNLLKVKLQVIFAVLILGSFAFASFYQTIYLGSEERFSKLNIFSDPEKNTFVIQKINEERSLSSLPREISSIFHNKANEYFVLFLKSYFENFSPQFLIFSGDGNPRHNMANFGAIYFSQIIALFFGLIFLFKKSKKIFFLNFFWILISPVPTAFLGVTHFLRSSFMLPPLILASGSGFIYLFSLKWGKVIGFCLIFLIGMQLIFFIEKLFFLSPNLYGDFWSYSAKKASEFANINKKKFDFVILSDKIDNIEYAYPLFADQKPEKIISQNKKRNKLLNKEFKKFDNVYIGNLPAQDFEDFAKNLEGKSLFITSNTDKDKLEGYQAISNPLGEEKLIFKMN